MVIGDLRAVTPEMGEWLQQIPGITSEIIVEKSTILGTAEILLFLCIYCFMHVYA